MNQQMTPLQGGASIRAEAIDQHDRRPGCSAGSVPAGAEALPLAVAAHAAINRLMDAGHPCVVAFSAGKDSSVLANLVLTTAAVRRALGTPVPRILVIHSDTGVENPEVRNLADGELARIQRFARDYGLPVRVEVGKPLLYSSWPVRVLSGRALPSFATSSGDCSVEWKVKVSNRLVASAFAELSEASRAAMQGAAERGGELLRDGAGSAPIASSAQGAPAPVIMTGVRAAESSARAASTAARGELSEEIWHDEAGRAYMSPILRWSTDDVWEYLGYASAGLLPSYSDFARTMQFYRDAGGSSCAVVGAMRMEEDEAKLASASSTGSKGPKGPKAAKGGCGARSGCWTCVRVAQDKSLQTMIESDPVRYGYMAGLGRLRDFIAATQFDWSRRNHVGRSIDAQGFIAIQADTYSPAMLAELLHYTLSLQALEVEAARRGRHRPRFAPIGPRELIAIDAMWSLYGLHPPFEALRIMRRVEDGDLREPPQVPVVPRSPTPRLGRLFVGADWDDDLVHGTGGPGGPGGSAGGRSGTAPAQALRARMRSGGIRNPVPEMFHEGCGIGSLPLLDGSVVTGYDTAPAFEVDEEAAADFLGSGLAEETIERLDRRLAVHAAQSRPPGRRGSKRAGGAATAVAEHGTPRRTLSAVRWTEGALFYLQMGMVMPAASGLGRWHRIAKRTDWLQEQGLHGQVPLATLQEMLRTQEAAMAADGPEGCATPSREEFPLAA